VLMRSASRIVWVGKNRMDLDTVHLKKNWTNTLSNKGWESFFRYPKKFKPSDEVLVSYSHMYNMEDVLHTIVKAAYIQRENGDIIYVVLRPNSNKTISCSSTYLIKPRALRRIISLYCRKE